MRHRHLGTLSMVSLLAACGSDLPVAYETEHLRIGTEPGHPLCAGDLVAYEAIIRRVEDELGVSMKSKYSLSIWSDEAWEAVRKRHCGPHRTVHGCTSYAENAIYTSWSSVEHELVHAAIPIENLTPFFAEGLAEVYGGHQTQFDSTAPADSLGLSDDDVDYGTAGHFVRWLLETWGSAKLGELVRLGKHADERFEDVYGLSFADTEAMYFTEAPFKYPGLDTCGGEPLDFADDLGGWRAGVAFDCGTGEHVRGFGTGQLIQRTFVIPVAGHYSVSTDADGLTLSRCATGPIEEAFGYDEFDDDDIPPSYAEEFYEAYVFFKGGTVLDLYFEAGKHEIQLFLLGFDEGEVNLSIWPSMGPRPVVEGD